MMAVSKSPETTNRAVLHALGLGDYKDLIKVTVTLEGGQYPKLLLERQISTLEGLSDVVGKYELRPAE